MSATALVTAALVLGGCQGASSDKPAGRTAEVGDDGVVEPSSAPGMPSGIVYARDDLKSMTKVLTVYDISTGQALGSAVAPYESGVDRRDVFDSAMARMVFVSKCKLYLMTLTDGAYTTAAEWTPPQAYGQGEQCFDEPTFRDDRIQVKIETSGSDSRKLASVDPGHPETPPKDEGAGSARQEKRYTVAGKSDSDVRVYTEDRAIGSVSVTGSSPQRKGEFFPASYHYKCNVRVDDTTFVCSSDSAEQPFGSVATATLNQAAASVTMNQVAPAGKATNATVLIAPDHKRLAIHDSTGWYTTTLGTSGAPIRQPLSQQENLGDLLFWS